MVRTLARAGCASFLKTSARPTSTPRRLDSASQYQHQCPAFTHAGDAEDSLASPIQAVCLTVHGHTHVRALSIREARMARHVPRHDREQTTLTPAFLAGLQRQPDNLPTGRMPITPFHFGPGALLHAVAPRHVSFLAFCAANVLIDLESLYNLIHHQHPVHAFFHTYVGATLVVITVWAIFATGRAFAARIWLPNVFGWQHLTSRQVCLGAALGAYSHVVLDSVMHSDIRPLAPLSDANVLLSIVSLGALHLTCIALGLLGLLIMAARWLIAEEQNAT
jgi:hypothetical protein